MAMTRPLLLLLLIAFFTAVSALKVRAQDYGGGGGGGGEYGGGGGGGEYGGEGEGGGGGGGGGGEYGGEGGGGGGGGGGEYGGDGSDGGGESENEEPVQLPALPDAEVLPEPPSPPPIDITPPIDVTPPDGGGEGEIDYGDLIDAYDDEMIDNILDDYIDYNPDDSGYFLGGFWWDGRTWACCWGRRGYRGRRPINVIRQVNRPPRSAVASLRKYRNVHAPKLTVASLSARKNRTNTTIAVPTPPPPPLKGVPRRSTAPPPPGGAPAAKSDWRTRFTETALAMLELAAAPGGE
ncbi:hypothetical protein PPROV_000726000 [Pycnococcus provasolii]|uniref:Uncharacterized protein n=1 Tax=Pycnococcus provasolii TaxID=41880 RepID=A0A830HNL6_9CHLO|nr:hypothetical protein PPROV_000726000 [Pycnococcus provasolii]